jgi:hypothetical protein
VSADDDAEGGEAPATPERMLGVVEAFTAVRDQCPSGAVQRVARQGLETVAREGADALPLQAFTLRTAVRGWQGAKAAQVKRALDAYLAGHEGANPAKDGAPGPAARSGAGGES